jgi:hypothetical protein
MGEHDALRPEIRENLKEFLRDLSELTARTGITVGQLLPGLGPWLETAVGQHTVAASLRYNAEESVYECDEVVNPEPEVKNLG